MFGVTSLLEFLKGVVHELSAFLFWRNVFRTQENHLAPSEDKRVQREAF